MITPMYNLRMALSYRHTFDHTLIILFSFVIRHKSFLEVALQRL